MIQWFPGVPEQYNTIQQRLIILRARVCVCVVVQLTAATLSHPQHPNRVGCPFSPKLDAKQVSNALKGNSARIATS